jgi:hypothetical protein
VTTVVRATDGSGWVVDFGEGVRRFYGDAGGAWVLLPDGTVGRQTAGTCDVKAPRGHGIVAFVRGQVAHEDGADIEWAGVVRP